MNAMSVGIICFLDIIDEIYRVLLARWKQSV